MYTELYVKLVYCVYFDSLEGHAVGTRRRAFGTEAELNCAWLSREQTGRAEQVHTLGLHRLESTIAKNTMSTLPDDTLRKVFSSVWRQDIDLLIRTSEDLDSDTANCYPIPTCTQHDAPAGRDQGARATDITAHDR